MKKAKTLIPLVAMLALLASCSSSGASSSISSSDTSGESSLSDQSYESSESDETGGSSVTATIGSYLGLLSSGYDADVYVNDEPLGNIALNSEGVAVTYDGEDTYYYVPEEEDDIVYVAESCLNLANEEETDLYYWMEWDSYYLNLFSLLTEEDFVSLNEGVYAFYPEEGDERCDFASIQLTLEYADSSDITDITIDLAEEEITVVAAGDTYTVHVNATGDEVDPLIHPYQGESISEIDTAVSKIQEGNYTLREEYLFLDDTEEDYIVDDSYTSDIYVDDGLAYDGWYELGYTAYDEGVYELTPVTDGDSTLWYVNTDFYGYTWFDMVGGCRISSELFESTGTDGEYSLIQGIDGLYADVAAYDPYASGGVDSITVTVGENNSIVLTCDYDGEYLIRVTYYNVGATSLPDDTLTKENVRLLKLSDYSESIVSSSANYDFATGLGTSDTALWNAAFECVDLPYYGFDGYGFGKAEGFDPFLGSYGNDVTPYSLYVKYLYAYYEEEDETYYYDYAWFYFAEYLIYHGFEETYETPEGSEDGYYVYTTSFEYNSQQHTLTLVDLGAYTTSSTETADELFILKIDMELSN